MAYVARVKDGTRGATDIKHPRAAKLCRCPVALRDGDDECIRCGRLVEVPSQESGDTPGVGLVRSTLPMVLHNISYTRAA